MMTDGGWMVKNCKWCLTECSLVYVPAWGDMVWICEGMKWERNEEGEALTPIPESCIEDESLDFDLFEVNDE